ncbi:hypothetical protein [Mangrovibacterium sp.]|uniref:hypothetical protein n=1 Tax=Mangrovibacterium sp. TaxID=1961364 RepID=UPI003564ADA7
MSKPINQNQLDEYLSKICKDEIFAKSPRYTEILSYLVEQALNGNDLKEHVIGLDLFEQNYNADKNDGIVRVYMYNLRKKLETYYAGPGRNDRLIFSVEKGSYNLKFVSVATNKNSNHELQKTAPPKRHKNLVLPAVILIVSLIAIGYFSFFNKKQYCWKAFLEKDASNLCILADQVILHRKGDNPEYLVINPEINSSSDFISYTKTHHIDSLNLMDYTFFTKAIPYSIHQLSRFFTIRNRDFSHIAESDFRYNDTKKNNIIYIGQYKTMSISKELFLKNSKIFKAHTNYFVTVKNAKETHYKPKFGEGVRSEYAMVSYMPVGNASKAIYFVSNHDIGTMAIVNNFTNEEFLTDFYKNLPSSSSYFNALFKVNGVNRTESSCELVELEILEQQTSTPYSTGD